MEDNTIAAGNAVDAAPEQPTHINAAVAPTTAQPTVQLNNNNDDTEQQPPLSKRALKKLKKQEYFLQKKQKRKEERKAAKQEAREQKKAKFMEFKSTMTEEEMAQWHAERSERMLKIKQEREQQKERLKNALESGLRVVIDLDFIDLMKDTEQRSITQQLMYSYAANVKSSKPLHLIFTSLHGKMNELVRNKISGVENWSVSLTDKSYLEYFGEEKKDQLVYLTADSSEELHELDNNKIYIIGGLVDRNRHKNVCFNKAESQGIATAKLPIGDFLKSSQVMCTNHVVEMLVKVNEGAGWKEAFESVIPVRKKNMNKEAVDGDGGDESGGDESDGVVVKSE